MSINFPYLTNTHVLQSSHIFFWFLLVNISWVPQFWGEARYFILVTEVYVSPRLLVYSQWGIVVQILRRLIILWSSHLGESLMVSGEERRFYSNKEKATVSGNSKGLEKEIGEVQFWDLSTQIPSLQVWDPLLGQGSDFTIRDTSGLFCSSAVFSQILGLIFISIFWSLQVMEVSINTAVEALGFHSLDWISSCLKWACHSLQGLWGN